MKITLSIFFILTLSTSIAQPNPTYTELGLEDGLPSDEVYDIIQDDFGDLWIATDNGLGRFNGSSIQVFTTKEGLPNNSIIKLFKDHYKRVWGLTYTGDIFYILHDSVTTPKFNKSLSNIFSHDKVFVSNIIVDDKDNICLTFDNTFPGYAITNIQDSTINFYQLRRTEDYGSFIYKKEILGHNIVGIGHHNEDYIEIIKKTKPRETDAIRLVTQPKTWVNGFNYLTLKRNLELVSINKDLYILENGRSTLLQFDEIIHDIYNVDSNIFLTTTNGVYHYLNAPYDSNLIGHYYPGLSISRIIQDSEKVYWISTVGQGVRRIVSLKTLSYTASGIRIPHLPYYSINFKNDTLGIVSYNTITLYDLNSLINPILDTTLLIEGLTINTRTITWSGATKLSFIWKNRLKRKKSEVEFIAVNGQLKASVTTKDIEINNSKGRMLNGILKTSNDTCFYLFPNRFSILVRDTLIYDSHVKFNRNVQCLTKTGNKIWIGTTKGLYLLEDSIYSFLGDENEYFKQRIGACTSDTLGNVIVNINGIGLGFIYKDTTIILSDRSFNFIDQFVYKKNELWMKSKTGIYLFEIRDGRYQLSYKLAYPTIKPSVNDYLIASNKDLFIIGNDEIIKHQNPIEHSRFNGSIHIDKITINNNIVNSSNNLDLNWSENNLRFNYNLTSLHQSRNTIYQYKLIGYSNSWITTKDNEVSFPRLDAGRYTFKVRGLTSLGKWVDKGGEISFRIAPHYTNTIWFKTIMLLFMLFLGFAIATALKERISLNRALLLANIQALKRQISPHFILNAMHSVRYLISKNRNDLSEQYILKFSKLLGNIVYSSENLRISILKELDNIENFVQMEQIRYEYSFQYQFVLPDKKILKKVFIPPMLIQPLAENAIHHGLSGIKNGLLKIEIKPDYKYLLVSIKDNGPGINFTVKRNSKKTNIGISNILERIDLINKLENKKHELNVFTDLGTECVLKIDL